MFGECEEKGVVAIVLLINIYFIVLLYYCICVWLIISISRIAGGCMSKSQSFPLRRKIQVVTGYNGDPTDIAVGGDPILGPYSYVSVDNCTEITRLLRERYPSHEIRVEEETDMVRLPQLSLEDEMKWVFDYLNKPSSW